MSRPKICDTCGFGIPVNSGAVIVKTNIAEYKHMLCGRCRKLKLDRICELADQNASDIRITMESNSLELIESNGRYEPKKLEVE